MNCLLNFKKYISAELLVIAIAATINFIMLNRCFFLSFVMTAIFYFPSLINGSTDAGFLYTGDVLGWYWPALAKAYALISSFNFTAIDYSSFNGSSDFFLSPSSHAYHPFVIIYSLLVPEKIASFNGIGRFLVYMLTIHLFLACYFSLKLLIRFLSFEFGAACFAATAFTFSAYFASAHVQPSFIFSVAFVPWAAYAALSYSEQPSLRNLLIASLPVLCILLSSYVPLGVASLAMCLAIIGLMCFIETSIELGLKRFFIAIKPFILSSFISLPYLYSVFSFYKETPAYSVPALSFSAYDMAETPHNLLRLISSHFSDPGQFVEFSLSWGIISIVITSIFLFGAKTFDGLTQKDWKIFKASALIYFATVLAIYGNYSVVSDLIYYLVPQVGKMHIYQRLLLPSQLLFAVMIALMLKSVVNTRPIIAIKIAIGVCGVAMFFAAYFVGHNPVVSLSIGLNDYLVFELLLSFLFACSLIFPGKTFIYSVIIILNFLPALDSMYNFSNGNNTFQVQNTRQVVALDVAEKQRVLTYLKRFSDKAVIKYVDITPLWNKENIETFPKSFPFLMLKEVRLSSYGGYMFYLGGRSDYMKKMPIGEGVAVDPDWELAFNEGVDFVVAHETEIRNGRLGAILKLTNAEDLLRLPNDVVIIPLRKIVELESYSKDVQFDNGVFRISKISEVSSQDHEDIAVGKIVTQSSTFAVADARLAVDGNTDGAYGNGSVSSTDADLNAWLDIDLGSSENVDVVKVWNRTDGSESRLANFWLFISDTPFSPVETAQVLQKRSATWSRVNFTPKPMLTIRTGGVSGRFVRIQLDGKKPLDQSYLSLAEVQIFRTAHTNSRKLGNPSDNSDIVRVNKFVSNNANYMLLNFKSSLPTNLNYLYWNNPRLRFYLNGKKVKPILRNGLWSLDVPAGINTIEVRYVHWPLRLFLILYGIYSISLAWVLIPRRLKGRIMRIIHGGI